jgi:hypothetical protein
MLTPNQLVEQINAILKDHPKAGLGLWDADTGWPMNLTSVEYDEEERCIFLTSADYVDTFKGGDE